MADLARMISVKFKGKVYHESELINLLKTEGYGNIRVGDADIPGELNDGATKILKRIVVNKDSKFHTLFIALGESGICEYFYEREGIRLTLYDNEEQSTNGGGEGMKIFLSVAVIFAFLFFISWVMNGDDDNYEDEPTYHNESDDKDFDGDVDYDDAEQYLEDSLEEDKNDGDDW